MKTIELTPQEFANFKVIYKGFCKTLVKNGKVMITANTLFLSYLGY